MKRVIGVKFKQLGKIYHFECLENETYKLDDKVIVETSRGIEYATVVLEEKNVEEEHLVMPLKIVRYMNKTY